MRSLLRNQQPVFYKLYKGQEEILDEWNNPTGSFLPIYSDLKSAMLCVSPNKGSSEVEQFGSLEDYDRTMTTADTTCDIDEDAILWVDGADPEGPYTHIVKQVAPWKNSISFAIKQVEVSEYEAEQKLFAEAKQYANHQAKTEYAVNQPGVEGTESISEEG